MLSQAKGSAYVEMKTTKVVCAVFDPREIPGQSEFRYALFHYHLEFVEIQYDLSCYLCRLVDATEMFWCHSVSQNTLYSVDKVLVQNFDCTSLTSTKTFYSIKSVII